MQYNFDKIVDRHNTNALKTDVLQERYGDKDLLPLWVADMDFETPQPIVDALKQRLEHPIFGYTQTPESFFNAIKNWLKIRQNFEVKREWLSYIPGIVKGIGLAMNVFTEKGDKIIIQTPVYHIFSNVIRNNERIVAENLLKLVDNQYEMDFENLEKIIDEKCKMLILSNPQNPSGKVWEKQTLQRLAEICKKHNILVISDEIHADLTLFDNKFTSFSTVCDAARENSITFGAPSKTFNIAGIVSSFSVVPNSEIRKKFYSFLEANELHELTIFSAIAAEIAYTQCDDYLAQLIYYLQDNILFAKNYFEKNIPQIKIMQPQASFLLWLDCRGLDLNHRQLNEFFIKKCRLAINDGEMFGTGGEGFMRMNIAVPREILKIALEKIKDNIC